VGRTSRKAGSGARRDTSVTARREAPPGIFLARPEEPATGIPLAVKDLFDTAGLTTTYGSAIFAEHVPLRSAEVVTRLEHAGYANVGKTNLHEFAYGTTSENPHFGTVPNPIAPGRIAGGSSGGSAAALAAGLADAALGSDTGGSIRQPAALTGTVGVKPTYGRVSRYGLIAFASSLDHIGPLTKSVKDAAIVLRQIAGRDPLDSTSADVAVPDYEQEIERPVRGLKIGVPKEYFGEGLDKEVRAAVEGAIEKLRSAGCEIVNISLPHTEYAIPTYYLVATAEASSNLARYDGVRYGFRARNGEVRNLQTMYRVTRDRGFGAEVKRRIMLGTYALSAGYYDAYYLKAQKVRALLTRDFEEAFKKVDAIVTPTTPTAAFKLGEKADDPLAMYLADIYTVTADLAGVPGISVPCGKTKAGLPIGVQVFARHFDEATMIRVAHSVEHSLAAKAA
jgi:aspartyl-tRNA(Asn)/glutamyl-tRNA(Gln) amidotransferase subunit A